MGPLFDVLACLGKRGAAQKLVLEKGLDVIKGNLGGAPAVKMAEGKAEGGKAARMTNEGAKSGPAWRKEELEANPLISREDGVHLPEVGKQPFEVLEMVVSPFAPWEVLFAELEEVCMGHDAFCHHLDRRGLGLGFLKKAQFCLKVPEARAEAIMGNTVTGGGGRRRSSFLLLSLELLRGLGPKSQMVLIRQLGTQGVQGKNKVLEEAGPFILGKGLKREALEDLVMEGEISVDHGMELDQAGMARVSQHIPR